MIYCPSCGIANRQGSRFCNECGATLPSDTGQRCPMCGEMNPIGNVYCDKCNARLVPLTTGQPPEEGPHEPSPSPIKGLSLPTLPIDDEPAPESAPEPAAGDWLAELRAEMGESETAEPAADDGIEPTELPDWLTEPGTPLSTPDEEPSSEHPPETADWLEQLRSDIPQEPEEILPEEHPGTPDWLSEVDSEPTIPSAEEAPLEEPSAATPDWLSGIGAAPMGEESPAEEAAGGPDWLAELEAPPISEEPVSEETVETPDWLSGLDAEPDMPPVEATPLEDEPATGTPDWLAELDTAPVSEEPISEEAAAVPDWLAGLEAPSDVPPIGDVFGTDASEMPDWLDGLEPPPAVPSPAAEEVSAVPEWLTELQREAPPEPIETPPLTTTFAAPDGEIPVEPPAETPDWISELETDAVAAPAEPEPISPEAPDWIEETLPATAIFTSEEIIPAAEEVASLDWLEELSSEEQAIAAPSAPLSETLPLTATPEVEGLIPADIPEWLEALRPKTEAEVAAEEPPETEGLLEGLRGTLAPRPTIEMAEEAIRVRPAAPSAAAIARAELLQELLSRPATPPQEDVVEAQRIGWTIARAAIALVLIAAIAAPMMVPSLFGTPNLPAANDFFDTIEQQVNSSTTVLVAFDYSPAEADEMDWVAAPILSHLLERGGQLLIASTRPEGPASAEGLLDRILEERLQDQPVHIDYPGYRPGEAAGVQDLMNEISDSGATLVVVLAAQPDDMRTWIEQTTLSHPGLPIVAGISARAEPMAVPYLVSQDGQLDGAVVGLAGAASYESRLGNSEQTDLRFLLNWLGTAQLAVIGLMLVGAVIFLVGGRRR